MDIGSLMFKIQKRDFCLLTNVNVDAIPNFQYLPFHMGETMFSFESALKTFNFFGVCVCVCGGGGGVILIHMNTLLNF